MRREINQIHWELFKNTILKIFFEGNNTIGKLLNLKGELMYTNSINVVSMN